MPEQHDRIDALSIAKWAIVLLVVVILVCLLPSFMGRRWPLAQAQSTSISTQDKSSRRPAQQAVVGSDCRQCHRAVVESFALETHGKSAKFMNNSLAASCASCHSNSEEHAEKSSPTRNGAPVGNPGKMASVPANESCLQCHDREKMLHNWQGGQHDRKDMSCLSCHSVHHAQSSERMLASLTVEETCLRCHADKRKAMFQRSTHLFRTESWRPTSARQEVRDQSTGLKMNCVTCHNPHGGEGRRMLVGRSLNDTCYQCHAEKRGPFLWEHAPVQENCMACHSPHGSNNVSLLNQRSHQLCQQCHINILARHQTVAGFDVFTFNRGCVNCHTQIHGSNHPAGKAFAR